jgi:hypothetical protein
MADITYTPQNLATAPDPPRILWPAVWAGGFAFVAIWSVFGLLGMAIFAGAANSNAAHAVTGMNVGMAIWSMVLTLFAMYRSWPDHGSHGSSS